MNTGPYSQPSVIEFLIEQFVPVRTECFWDNPTELMRRFDVKWTPTFLVHDTEGKEHHRFVGYVPADDLFAHLWLGRGKILYDLDRYAEAIPVFETVLSRHPDAGAAPEAAFLRGVAGYKATNDPKELRRLYDMLAARYPQSEWARRAEPYSAIPL
jgi:tetratricopeptide (TPR) repeat protein